MSEFLGMALYTKEEIGSAIDNYKTGLESAKTLLEDLINNAENKWHPSWWDKLWRIETLREKYSDGRSWFNYTSWLLNYDYMEFDNETKETFSPYDFNSTFTYNLSYWGAEYTQIRSLFNGGKDCYLNPNQAKFVNYFKDDNK